jgi:hypothetical protein
LEFFLAPTSTCVSTIFTTNPNDIKVHIEYYLSLVICPLPILHFLSPLCVIIKILMHFLLFCKKPKIHTSCPKTSWKSSFVWLTRNHKLHYVKSSKIMILRSRKLGHCDGKCYKLTTIYHLLFFNMNFLNDADWLQT